MGPGALSLLEVGAALGEVTLKGFGCLLRRCHCRSKLDLEFAVNIYRKKNI